MAAKAAPTPLVALSDGGLRFHPRAFSMAMAPLGGWGPVAGTSGGAALHGAEFVLSHADIAAAAKRWADDIDAQALARFMPPVLKDRAAC